MIRLKQFEPDKIKSYFKVEWFTLLIVTISGLIYNIGLLAGPYFEGQMVGSLIDILKQKTTYSTMVHLVLFYFISIAIVQGSRYLKRFYVRRFANNINKRMKDILYANLVRKEKRELEEEGAGSIMTKAILDVDDCVEGMRKFTTEIFDTGVALLAYAGMLLYYDYKIALLTMLFPPISYFLAEKMKTIIQKTGAQYKIQAGLLSDATLDRATNAITYRVYGREENRKEAYEEYLCEYETSAIQANIFSSILPPIYRVLSMLGVLFILYFGSKNILETHTWTIATLTTFLSCFAKLAKKSSSAAKLFNSVHKADVSWKRIKPYLKKVKQEESIESISNAELVLNNVSFSYPSGDEIFHNLSLTIKQGQLIGVTGPVACGKSTLGKMFLCEYPYTGSIQYDKKELREDSLKEIHSIFGYLGHDVELLNDTIVNNISMGSDINIDEYLNMVCFKEEVDQFEQGKDTLVGDSGIRLSGGQGQRLALARTIATKKPIYILDDPFSALDKETEKKVFQNITTLRKDSSFLILSHRLYLFPQMDQIIYMDEGKVDVGSHVELMKRNETYRRMFLEQESVHEDKC